MHSFDRKRFLPQMQSAPIIRFFHNASHFPIISWIQDIFDYLREIVKAGRYVVDVRHQLGSILVNKIGRDLDNDGVGTQKRGEPRGPIVSIDINDSL